MVVTAVCRGTKRDGTACTRPAAKGSGSGYCYLHDPDPAIAKRRRRNASRAATLGNSKVGAEIRSTRLLVRDLVETTISGELDPLVRKRLTEVVQLVQSYCRLAELEIASGESPRAGDVALPEATAERIAEWAESEDAKMREKDEVAEELCQVMQAHGHDAGPLKAFMGG